MGNRVCRFGLLAAAALAIIGCGGSGSSSNASGGEFQPVACGHGELLPLGSRGDSRHSELPSDRLHFSCSNERIFERGHCHSLRTSGRCDCDAQHFYARSGSHGANGRDSGECGSAAGPDQPGRDRDLGLAVAIDDDQHQSSGFCLIGTGSAHRAYGRGNGPGKRFRCRLQRLQRAGCRHADGSSGGRDCFAFHSHIRARHSRDHYIDRRCERTTWVLDADAYRHIGGLSNNLELPLALGAAPTAPQCLTSPSL